jgi:hypothetical protein
MATETLTFKCETYYCEPCSLKQGTLVQELVRMIPCSVVAFGKLVGTEYYCCPICFEPKFDVKTKRKVGDEARVKGKASGAKDSGDAGAGRGGGEPTPASLRLVSDTDGGSST